MYIIDIKALYICLLFCFLLSYRDSETDGDSYVRKSAKGLTILRTQSEYLSYCCSRIASPRLKWHMSSKQTKKRRRTVEQSTPLLLFPQFPFPSERVRNIAVELACYIASSPGRSGRAVFSHRILYSAVKRVNSCYVSFMHRFSQRS